MWALDNRTPYAAERTWVRDKDGAEVWIVAVKATFDIHPDGTTTLAKEQLPLFLVPQYSGAPGKSSLLYDADLVRTKLTTDIILRGHAYAPGGAPTTSIDVTLRVGDLTKTLRVTGDRYYQRSLMGVTLTAPQPFVTMPIVYERAFGGTEFDDSGNLVAFHKTNPIGTGFAKDRSKLLGKLAPNIEYPIRPQANLPPGFGPIPQNWSPRLELAGTYDQKWQDERQPLLPIDFDDRFYQSAPADQRTNQFLRGGDEVELINLTPNNHLRFCLPRIAIGFRTQFDEAPVGGDYSHHRGVLHTVLLEPDASRVALVWHTHLQCHPKVYKLRRTVVFVKKPLKHRPTSPASLSPAEAV